MINNQNNKHTVVGKSTHCTSFGVCKNLQLKLFRPPRDLEKALKNSLKEYPNDSRLCKKYTKLMNNLHKIDDIKSQYYAQLFKILLYMEDYEVQLRIAKHDLKDEYLKVVSDTFEVTVPTLDEDDPYIQIGDKAIIQNQETKFTYTGKIVKIIDKKLYVFIFKQSVIKKLLDQKVSVHFCALNWPIMCSHYALHVIYKHRFSSLLYPTIDASPYALPEIELDWVSKSVAQNPEQRSAVINILHSSAYPAPYILFGPPGTGKTTTLVEAIFQIRKQYRSNILICASSNAAADVIAKRLLDKLPCKDVFRMYASSKCWNNIDDKIYPSSNFIDDTVLYLPKDIFVLKKIIIATLITSARLENLKLRCDHFSHIFIDEASQSMELESLIPLAVMSSQSSSSGSLSAQLVIAGDPHQLGPIIHCKRIEHLLGQSLLERLLKCEPYRKVNDKYNSRYITKLIRNYRSHRAILHIPNKLFYDGELKSYNESNLSKITSNWSILSNRIFPIIFSVVKGKEIRTPSMSVYNTEEIAVVIKYTRQLMCAKIGTRKIRENDIGIVTPFKQQKLLIARELMEHKLNKITVGTIETFQGQEKEIILITAVRSELFYKNGVEHIGFLSNRKRFNVAITRAKSLLIIVGNPSVLCHDEHWNALWQYCKENNACYPDIKNTT